MVKMDGVDIDSLQFDHDLTWAALFVHPDGTVYARYGSRSIDGPMAQNSARGLMATMRRVLEAHEKYPDTKHLFEKKRGPRRRFKRPEEIPALQGPGRREFTRDNCIHCHHVHEALDQFESRTGAGLPEKVYKFPLPRNVGLVIDRDLLPAGAGIEAGDELGSLDGQAILSIADFQFVLHHAADDAELEVEIRRDGKLVKKMLRLRGAWRQTDFTWRASMKGFPPDRGLYLRTLGSSEKSDLGIDEAHVALEVRELLKPAAIRSGLDKGDIIVGYDGEKDAISALRFEDYLRLTHFLPGSVLKLDVLRDGKVRRVEVRF